MRDPSSLVWITGASSGIGRALALRLARADRRVIVSARRIGALTELAQEDPAHLLPWPLDVTDRVAVTTAVPAIEALHGPIGLAVLNAGTHRPMSAVSFDTVAFRQLVDVNLMGVAHCLEALVEPMGRRGAGHIAVVASLAGYGGLPTAAAYGATKAALINMCEALKLDCDALGIKLQLVNPGFVATPLTARNDFPMPFLIPVDKAVERLVVGLASSRFEISFPRRFALLLKLLRVLPYRLYFPILRRTTRS